MIARRKLEWNGNRAQPEGDRRISRKTWVWVEDFIAGFEEGHHGKKQGDLAARRDHDGCRRNSEAAGAGQVGGNFFAEGGDSDDRAVAVFTFGQSFGGGVDNGLAGMEIRFA